MSDGPLLASVVVRSDPDAVPLLEARSSMHHETALLAIEAGAIRATSPADLGIEIAPYRFALRTDDLVGYLKPRFLAWLAERHPDRPILYVDAACFITDDDAVSGYQIPADVTLFAALPPGLAGAKVSTAAAVSRGLGVPTVRVVGLLPGPAASAILERWTKWLDRSYTADARSSIVDAEQRFLATLPGSSPGVGWDHAGLFGRWSDLATEAARPAIIGMEGADEHVHGNDPSQEMLTTRLRSTPDHADLLERFSRIAQDPPVPFRSGDLPSPEARTIYRAVDPHGSRWSDPADDLSRGSFRSWLGELDRRGLSRFAQAVYWSRPDLWPAFPAARTGVETLASWMAANGLTVTDTPAAMPDKSITARARSVAASLGARYQLPWAQTIADARPGPRREPAGVNLIGFASAGTGLGVAMRATIDAVEQLGVAYGVVDASERIFAPPAPLATRTTGCHHEVTIFHLSPREILDYAEDTLAYRSVGSYHVGFWFWETDRVPAAWRKGIETVDEIWVSSEFVADAFRRETSTPVHVVGLPVAAPAELVPDRTGFGPPSPSFVVLFVADAFSSADRKNPFAGIEAFRAAFGPTYDDVHLVLKVGNLAVFPRLAARLEEATRDLPVTIIGENLDQDRLWRLIASADAYLSLHAAEGLGLTILEAMAAGVPVITTGFGGPTDFATADNAMIVGYDRVPASGPMYGGHGTWASPHVTEAAGYLRRLRDDPGLRARLGASGRATAATWSKERFAATLAERLRAIGFEV